MPQLEHSTDNHGNRGVAVGSSIGHAIGGFFGGGSSTPAEQQNGAVAAQGQSQEQNSWGPRSCEVDAKQFTKCLDDNQGNMQICNWYLEQLVCHPMPLLKDVGSIANIVIYAEGLPGRSKSILVR